LPSTSYLRSVRSIIFWISSALGFPPRSRCANSRGSIGTPLYHPTARPVARVTTRSEATRLSASWPLTGR